VRLASRVEAKRGVLERGVLERWRIGNVSRRLGQIGWRRWTIGKISRRSGHGSLPIPLTTIGKQSSNSGSARLY